MMPLFCRSELFRAQEEKPGEQPPPELNPEWLRWPSMEKVPLFWAESRDRIQPENPENE